MAEVKTSNKLDTGAQEGFESTRTGQMFAPRADIYESKEYITILADMPGVDQNSVDITLEKNQLTITGAVQRAAHNGYTLSYGEYQAGDYRRAFTLSNEIDRNDIEATFKNGVLKLTLPKRHSEERSSKKINIKPES